MSSRSYSRAPMGGLLRDNGKENRNYWTCRGYIIEGLYRGSVLGLLYFFLGVAGKGLK